VDGSPVESRFDTFQGKETSLLSKYLNCLGRVYKIINSDFICLSTVESHFYIFALCTFCDFTHYLYGTGHMPIRALFPIFSGPTET